MEFYFLNHSCFFNEQQKILFSTYFNCCSNCLRWLDYSWFSILIKSYVLTFLIMFQFYERQHLCFLSLFKALNNGIAHFFLKSSLVLCILLRSLYALGYLNFFNLLGFIRSLILGCAIHPEILIFDFKKFLQLFCLSTGSVMTFHLLSTQYQFQH